MNNRPAITGNLAYKLDYEAQRVRKPVRTAKTQQSRRQAAKRLNLAVLLFYVAIICAMAFCLIGREVKIYAQNAELAESRTELLNLQAKTKEKMMEAEAALDLKQIEADAVATYNMQRPETHQVVYVDLKKDDYVETKNNEEADFNLGKNILGIIANW